MVMLILYLICKTESKQTAASTEKQKKTATSTDKQKTWNTPIWMAQVAFHKSIDNL